MDNINYLLSAAGITVGLAVCSLFFGLALSMLFTIWEAVKFKPVSWTCTIIVTMIRGLPEVLVVLSIYFGLSMFYLLLVDGIQIDLYFLQFPLKLNVANPNDNIAPFWCGVVALSLLYASYGSQTLRGAIKAVPYGQWEAGHALGLNKLAIFYRLIIPQMWKHALPGLGNQWLVLLKDTALVSLIGVNDIMKQAESIVTYTKQPFNWYLTAALLYLMITFISQYLLKRFEQYSTRFERRSG